MLKSLIRFGLAGAANTLLTYLLYVALLYVVPYPVAYAASYITGVLINYVVHSLWVFEVKPTVKTAVAWPFIYAFQFSLGFAMLWFFINIAHVDPRIAPLLNLALLVPVGYLLSHTVFKHRN